MTKQPVIEIAILVASILGLFAIAASALAQSINACVAVASTTTVAVVKGGIYFAQTR